MTAVTLNDVAEMPALLTVAECSAFLRVSKSVCYEQIARKQIPSIRVSPRRILIPTARLLALANLEPEYEPRLDVDAKNGEAPAGTSASTWIPTVT
jgi:excisionase family DNA binding protein